MNDMKKKNKRNVTSKIKLIGHSLLARIVMCICLLATPLTAFAQGNETAAGEAQVAGGPQSAGDTQSSGGGRFSFYTSTPGISLTAGESADFDLNFVGVKTAGEDVTLEVKSLPDNFHGYFKSGSHEVNKVHALPNGENTTVNFALSTDVEATQGQHDVVLQATTESGLTDTLTLTINISEQQVGDSNFTVEYPDQEGATGTIFSYSTTVINNSLTNQNYNFSANAPAGWGVTFTSNDTQVSSLDVDAGASAGVKITVTPPDKVAAGDYEISCSATSAKEKLSTKLNVKILGTYDIEVTTKDGNLAMDAYANKASDMTMVIKNNGNIDLENVQLSSQANTDWKVEFDESKIDKLPAGTSQEVKVHITPSKNSITGDYVADITASCDNKSDTAELRITVKTHTGWGIFAILIIAAVIAELYYVMKKYGRR